MASARDGSIAEISIPRSVLGGLTDFRVLFRAINQPFTTSFDPSGVDYFPNNAATSAEGYFSYSIDDTNNGGENLPPDAD